MAAGLRSAAVLNVGAYAGRHALLEAARAIWTHVSSYACWDLSLPTTPLCHTECFYTALANTILQVLRR